MPRIFDLTHLIRFAGLIQIAEAAANLALPPKIHMRENLARVQPIIRQIFLVHWFYVLFTLVTFGVACLLYAPELAAGRGLGRFFAAALCVFWALRVPIQLVYFDRQFRRANRLADVAFTFAGVFLTIVFAFAAFRGVV